MTLERRGHDYPAQALRIVDFPPAFSDLFPQPIGLVEDEWPPIQLRYLGEYLKGRGCATVLIESHYVDRDFIDDVALLYARSLRAYPNYSQRLHFFREGVTADSWRKLLEDANRGQLARSTEFLQQKYIGYSVVRPLPGTPIGRTVLETVGPESSHGLRREFSGVREYSVHVAGFTLNVSGLAFQQQDQGVSACATAALWSAIHKIAPLEGLQIVTPAAITQAASRYFLPYGRALPSEGLTIDQICEAARSAGLAPVVVQGLSLQQARAQIHTYLSSGFPPVLAIQRVNTNNGHAVCGVGLKLGDVPPQSDPEVSFRDGATALQAIYLHDDRLGPYAVADLLSYTVPGGAIRPAIRIRWPSKEPIELELSTINAIVIPVPVKLRLTVARMRRLAFSLAEALGGTILPQLRGGLVVDCRYTVGAKYQTAAFGFSLSDNGLRALLEETVLSRYVGEIRLSADGNPLLDVLLDATETEANPSVLACIARSHLPKEAIQPVESIARRLGVRLIV